MGNRMKEDERIERTIRGLMKLPENRRCINCNNLGPQYVCTTFLTFVCTNCSGIHREFTHRVKSVSVAKFTAEEATALQAGGNERARQIYFREWDLRRHSFPDGSNLHRLRDFIKHVYVDRKYTGERSGTGLPRLTSRDKEEANESRKVNPCCRGSRSPYEEDKYEQYQTERSSSFGKYEDRHAKYFHDDRRSPRYSPENPREGGHKRNPVRFEIVDDRVRDDRFGSRRFSLGDPVPRRKLPSSNTNMNSSPVVRPLEEILGENCPTPRVDEIAKEINGEHADCPARNQDSGTGKPGERRNDSQSLIDFGTETETPDSAAISQMQQSSSDTSTSWASVGLSAKQDSSQAPTVKTLETLLFELSVPSVKPASDISHVPGRDGLSTPSGDSILPAPIKQMPELVNTVPGIPNQHSSDNILQASSSSDTSIKATNEWPFESVQKQQPSPSVVAGSSSFTQAATLSTNNQPSFSSLAHNDLGSPRICVEQSSQSMSRPAQDTITGVEYQTLPVETKSSNRKELPADLFTFNTSYLSMTTQVSGWQTGPPQGMGFNYYLNAMSVPAFSNPAKSTNPFDISSDEQGQLPSMASLQGALPNVVLAPRGLPDTSSLGTYSSQLIAPQSPATAHEMPPQLPFIGSALAPCAYMGQEVHNNIQHSRPQGIGGFGSDGAVFSSIGTAQQPAGIYSGPGNTNPNPNPSSMGGNPFA